MNLREKFYEKAKRDYDKYINDLKRHDLDYIINRSYETAVKEEMLCYFELNSREFSVNEIKVLNKANRPLTALYDEWISCDLNIGDELKEHLKTYTFFLIQENKKRGRER